VGVACKRLGLPFVGFEIDKVQARAAAGRIASISCETPGQR
jgi:hypothetical protein